MPSSPPAAVAKPAPPAPPVLPPGHVLQLAAAGCLAALRSVLSGVDVNACDSHGRTALHVASAEGHAHVVRLLLAHGADASRVDTHGNTPGADAARHGRIHVLQVLAAADAPLPGKLQARLLHGGPGPQRSLVDSIVAGDKRAATVAVSAFGAHVNRSNYDRRTPLHYAVDCQHAKVAKFLLNAGADPTLPDRWGNTPAKCAAESANLDIRTLFDNLHDDDDTTAVTETSSANPKDEPNATQPDNTDVNAKEQQPPTILRVSKRADTAPSPSSNSELQSPGNTPVIKRVVTVPSSSSGNGETANGAPNGNVDTSTGELPVIQRVTAPTTSELAEAASSMPVIRKISTPGRPRSAPQIVRVKQPNGDSASASVQHENLAQQAPAQASTPAPAPAPAPIPSHHYHSVPPSPMEKAPVSSFRRTQSQSLLHSAEHNTTTTTTPTTTTTAAATAYEWHLNNQADPPAPPNATSPLNSAPFVQETAIN